MHAYCIKRRRNRRTYLSGRCHSKTMLRRRIQDSTFLYIGGTEGLESKLVPQENIPFKSIDITGFRRKLSMDNVKTVMRFFKA